MNSTNLFLRIFNEANKERFIRNNPNLSQEQKDELLAVGNLEQIKGLDWNKASRMTYDDLKVYFGNNPLGKFTKDIDYKLYANTNGLYYVSPLNYSFQVFAESKEFLNNEGSWCIGHEKKFWTSHTDDDNAVFLIIANSNRKFAIQYYYNESKIEIWNCKDHPYCYSLEEFLYNIENKSFDLKNAKNTTLGSSEKDPKILAHDQVVLNNLDISVVKTFINDYAYLAEKIKTNNYMLIPESFNEYADDQINNDSSFKFANGGFALAITKADNKAYEILKKKTSKQYDNLKFINNFNAKLRAFFDEYDFENSVDANSYDNEYYSDYDYEYDRFEESIKQYLSESNDAEEYTISFLVTEDKGTITLKLTCDLYINNERIVHNYYRDRLIKEHSTKFNALEVFDKTKPENYHKFNSLVQKYRKAVEKIYK